MEKISVNLNIIGIIHSPYKLISEVPFGPKEHIFEIEINKELIKGLTDIEGFSHLHVFYWLHKSEGYNLIVQPPWNTKPHGLFATRSPHRPNPIGYSVVELVERKDNILRVKGLDVIEGTPVFDIKPFIKKRDCRSHVVSGWMEDIEL
ncbi:MAG: tRNA (N6-threonylcarbamoyladenosine(37)-N6)-methyltransferase TrmO [Candidatus Asgardarchaeum californiense]|nr:MAG: tRNA (N6-threonylcarbamoyladenosine(37)-N6)-methyltransferase TrmO [Candidatus Asgardarchaeum californiense]